MAKFRTTVALIIGTLLISLPLASSAADKSKPARQKLKKRADYEDRKYGYHDGNKVSTIFFNYGAIGDYTEHRLESGVYPKGTGRPYFAEFTPVVGGEVFDTRNIRRHIFSDGAASSTSADNRPTGGYYSFEPIRGYADPTQDLVALSDALDNDGPDKIPDSEDDDGKPDSWPWRWPDRPDWFNPQTGVPYWNGQYGAYRRADQESYYRMNDYFNDEFSFYPDPDDSTKRGLGVEVQVRGYQWSHPLAEDIIIWTYWITNKGKTDYEKIVFGMYGDADVGGGPPLNQDQRDDDASFRTLEDIVYQWDHDNRSSWGSPVAYFGYKFLESPSNPDDGIDNDEDGMVDESQDDGIDNDEDWNPERDDVGSDGKGPGHPEWPGPDADGTELNGLPDPGEPNFEYTDNDEADQIGLTSFTARDWNAARIQFDDDEEVWKFMVPGTFESIVQNVDITFLYGSGYFPMMAGARRKFAIALLFGEDFDDILRNAITMQRIYNADYNFAKPPEKPHVTAVPGDHKVTLYWDKRAEELTWDPIYGNDLEGYMIYRSTDPAFNETFTITNAYGVKAFNKPIAQFDKIDGLKGPHPIGQDGLQLNMGNDSGLAYMWTDTTVENGQRYYYAVSAYDYGYNDDFYLRGISDIPDLLPISPAISSKRIKITATGEVIATDINTVEVTPNAPASGFVPPKPMSRENRMIRQVSGPGTGFINIEVIDPLKVQQDWEYHIFFDDTTYSTTEERNLVFSVLNTQQFTETFTADTVGLLLDRKNIYLPSVVVSDIGGSGQYIDGIDYVLDAVMGHIKTLKSGAMYDASLKKQNMYQIEYQYMPVANSEFVHGEEFNPFFDGLYITVNDDILEPDHDRSIWLSGDSLQAMAEYYGVPFDPNRSITDYTSTISVYYGGKAVPYDYEVVVYDSVVVNAINRRPAKFRVFNTTTGDTANFAFLDSDRDSSLSDQDAIVVVEKIGGRDVKTWQFKFWSPPDSIIYDIVDKIETDSTGATIVVKDTLSITVIPQGTPPKAGDIFHVFIKKPFSSQDRFRFTTHAAFIDKTVAREDTTLDKIAVVPNPYVVTASWESMHFFSSGRGERQIQFIHLPQKCTIKIFTLRGFLVDTIEHDSSLDDGSESWDLLTKDGMEVAYGVYIYHVDVAELGKQKIGKFAVIK